MPDINDEDATELEDQTQLGSHGKQDRVYMRSLSAAVVHRTPRHLIAVILVLAVFFIAAILWMHWASIDVVVRGSGKVSPASQVQNIQSLEGGIVEEILVDEGEVVDVGQPLLKISDIAFTSSFEENQLLYLELLARASRLSAEAFGRDFESHPEVEKLAPELMRSEASLYESNREQLGETMSILEEKINQQQAALREAQSKRRQLAKSLELMRKEIEIKKPLRDRGIISEVEYLQLQQREAEIEGELESVRLSIPRIESTIEEARFGKQKEILEFQNKAKRELNEINAEIGRLREAQTALQDRVKRTTLRSPVRGVVQRLHVNTIGGVVNPGGNIIDVVPREDSLLVEVRIAPPDIGSIHVGQFARLKFSAYDFALHGSLQGIVTFISADSITTEEGESYFLARIKPTRSFMGGSPGEMPIKVGMTAEADILTEKKTILSYLTEPMHRGFDKALRER